MARGLHSGVAMDARLAPPNPPDATAQVVDSALGLIRAELKLLGSYAKSVLARAGLSLAVGWLAMTLGQVALVLLVLTPVLFSVRPWPLVLLTIVIALVLAGAAAATAVWALKSLRRLLEPTNAPESAGR